ncbi:AraC family transcriptional regulator [Micromonospora sp. RTGN7]|uniref:helix-turn-helix transcriptional regulator n=1 Tax=Micromonospora sp. RTGN7 TaxID=3016526 RepID=UPI0029FEE35D|nr:AraC family transcriptional regulator [Micromonospora sp. RTGN7]
MIRSIERMLADLSVALPLADLARVALFSPFHFHRVFRAVTGETPARFLAALRMAQARRLLLHSRLTVGAISGRVGYTSVGTFTTQFTRLVGVPPERFRRLVRALSGRVIEPAKRPLTVCPGDGTVLTPVVRAGLSDPGGRVLIGVAPVDAKAEPATWAAAVGPGPVRISPGLPSGRYRVQGLLLRSGWTGAAALIDGLPDSYLIGRAELAVSHRASRLPVRLRSPQPTDPPVLSAEPVRLLVGMLSAASPDALVHTPRSA